MEPIRGRITKVHKDGYGFIISDEMKFTKFFFHWTALNHNTKKFTELTKGMLVEFTPQLSTNEDSRGPRAIKITVLTDEVKDNALDTNS